MTKALDRKLAGQMLWAMAAGRRLEEIEAELFARREMPGFAHLGIGEEAAFVGAVAALEDFDVLLPTHRGISGVIMKGVPLRGIAAEMLGRATGTAQGRGGIPHVASVELGVLGMSGTVGGQFPIALGYGLALRRKGSDALVLCCFGDGTFNRGTFHEAVNMMAIWRLPVVLFCDNNGYATSVPYRAAHPLPSIGERVAGYGIEASQIDGNDADAVHSAVATAAARARSGEGPQLVEALTSRWRGHYEGDSQSYRPPGEVEEWTARDPLVLFRDSTISLSLLTAEEADGALVSGGSDAEEAVATARDDPFPEPDAALLGLYTD